MKKVSFDVQMLVKVNKTGIGWCVQNLLMNLPHMDGVSYQLNYFSLGTNDEQLKSIEHYKSFGYQIKKCNWCESRVYRIMSNIIPLPYSHFFGDDSNVSVFFNYIVPPGVRGRKIVLVYDMVYKAFPETVKKRTKSLLKMSLEKTCERADHIITISEFSKREIIKYLGIPEGKISIMPCGVDLSIYHPDYSEEMIVKTLGKYNVPRNYLLYLGTLEPRKNIVRMIEAYSLAKEKNTDIPKLVMAGGKGWVYSRIFETVHRLKLEDDIIFTGYISEFDVPMLMKGARAFLFPSLYEGFGMPPLEAMACGTPVLVSNVASLPEVVGEASIKVDPFSVESIKSGIELITYDESIRIELSQKGLERAKMFTWDRAAQVLLGTIKTLL